MPTRSKVLGNRTIHGEEALRLAGGLESLHPPLPLTGGLVRILCAVVEIAVMAMFHPASLQDYVSSSSNASASCRSGVSKPSVNQL
jgi:hypothetical protein